MNIGFDAKRAFENSTGLGHYSRTLITDLANFYKENNYCLFTPKTTKLFSPTQDNITIVTPEKYLHKKLKAVWRSNWIKQDIKDNHIDIYHGLSHEIPANIQHTKVKTVVTIHDLIFEKYPEQFSAIDKLIYRKKFTNACKNATAIIAISEQTKKDIIELYHIAPEKIKVCYQSCNDIFRYEVSDNEKEKIRATYNLPQQYFLSVGSIIERKNLLNVVKAMAANKGKLDIPLVVIGGGKGNYYKQVKQFITQHGLEKAVIFLNENEAIKNTKGFRTSADFPAIYQMATAMLYPSFYEGFGIPVLEALSSNLPAITSNVSCLPETGGKAALYVNPNNVDEIANAMLQITSTTLRQELQRFNSEHLQKFENRVTAENVMNVYKKVYANEI
jgi:glycosyltransferase involved in cell wall biosynthesis